jgi:hypothetical protein
VTAGFPAALRLLALGIGRRVRQAQSPPPRQLPPPRLTLTVLLPPRHLLTVPLVQVPLSCQSFCFLPVLLLFLLKPALKKIFRVFALLSLTVPLSCQSFCFLPVLLLFLLKPALKKIFRLFALLSLTVPLY